MDKKNDVVNECNKLKFLYQKEDSTATKTVQIKLKVTPIDESEDKFFPSKDDWKSVKYNESWEVDFESIPSGEYLAQLKVNDSIYKHKFIMHKKCTSGYCCTVCDRDLTVTFSSLKSIFPKNKNLTQTQATLFNDALKKGDFNTCKKQVHFFSQVSAETKGLKKFTEGGGYSFDSALNLHKKKPKVKEIFIKQSFFDENNHLDYFYIRALKNDTVSGTRIGLNFKTYKNGSNQLKIPTGKPNSRKAKKGEKVVFTIPTYPNGVQRKAKQKKFFNVIYAKTNGNNGGDDGWNYRGQGAIHLTGKEIYRETSTEANKLFEGENFDWESNPEDVSTKNKDRIYSAVAYFIYRYKKIRSYSDGIDRIQKQDVTKVTYDVNGGYNGLPKRKTEYIRISNIYFLNQCK